MKRIVALSTAALLAFTPAIALAEGAVQPLKTQKSTQTAGALVLGAGGQVIGVWAIVAGVLTVVAVASNDSTNGT